MIMSMDRCLLLIGEEEEEGRGWFTCAGAQVDIWNRIGQKESFLADF